MFVWFFFRFSRPTLCFESWLLSRISKKNKSSGGRQPGAKPGARCQKVHYARHEWGSWERFFTVNDCEKARKPGEKIGNHDKPPWWMGNSTGFSPKGNPPISPLTLLFVFVCQDQHINFICLACRNPTVLMGVSNFKSCDWFSRRLAQFSGFKQQNWKIMLLPNWCWLQHVFIPQTKDDG